MESTEKTIHVIYQCKHHKQVVRRTFLQKVYIENGTRQNTVNGFSYPYRRIAKTEFFEDGELVSMDFLPNTTCTTCKPSDTYEHGMSPRVVEGKISFTRNCDARCLNATGHNCDCQCGGENHGRAYDSVQVVR